MSTDHAFEAEARRLYQTRLDRIRNMTPEEQEACARFMMPGYLQRAATLRLNEHWGADDMDVLIAECVQHWRTEHFQSSEEYEQERDRLIEADRQRTLAERQEWARQEAARRNARQRWVDQGNDPRQLGYAERQRVGLDEQDVDTLMEHLRDALEFHTTKTRSQEHIAWWSRVQSAVETGEVPAELMAEFERRSTGVKVGSRFHSLWELTGSILRQLTG